MKKILFLIALMSCFSFTSVVVEEANNFSEPQKVRVLSIASNVEKVINSVEFKVMVVNHTYAGNKRFVDNGGSSNEEIYKILMDGKEQLFPVTDQAWNIRYKLGPLGSNIIGETNASRRDVTLNQSRFDTMLDSELAKTICHEETHKLGFGHDFRNNSARPFSVPYGVGECCMILYRKLVYDDSHLAKKYSCGLWCKFKAVFN